MAQSKWLIYPLNMVIFHHYVSLPEVKHGNKTLVNGSSWIQPYLTMSKLVLPITGPTSLAQTLCEGGINSTFFVVSLVNTISAVSWIYPM